MTLKTMLRKLEQVTLMTTDEPQSLVQQVYMEMSLKTSDLVARLITVLETAGNPYVDGTERHAEWELLRSALVREAKEVAQ